MRCIAAAALLVATAAAGPEPDAAVAEPARWVEPRGCASGSFRSRALPVVTEVEEAWQLAYDAIEAPPVHWDGTGYVVVRVGGKPHLVAFDLATGKERARVVLRGLLRGSPLLVWDHLAMLQPDGEQITGYRLNGKRLDVVWQFRGSASARPRAPAVHDNEIYCFLGDSLARIRPGASAPSWTTPVTEGGALAVFGGHVYVASFAPAFEAADGHTYSELSLSAFRRSNGAQVTSQKVCQARCSNTGPTLQLMATASTVYVGSDWPLLAADGLATHAIVGITRGEDRVDIGTRPGLWTCSVPPAHHPKEGTLLLSPPREARSGESLEWCADRGGSIYKLAAESEQPECFKDRVSPTVLGAVVYFGSWAADVDTGEILWRLPVKQVTSAAVPADGLVLVVDDGRLLRAFRGRGKR